MHGSCFSTVKTIASFRSLSIQSDSSRTYQKNEVSSDPGVENARDADDPSKAVNGRKIMIVAESNVAAKNALHWALTHVLHSQDLLFLLHVTEPSKQDLQGGRCPKKQRIPDFLPTMENICGLKRPEVNTEIIIAEGKERGPTVVEAAKQKEVDMLILGMKKRCVSWRLLMMWAGNRRIGRDGVVEYCIQNAGCTAIAVRKNKDGGYLITTKHHKNYWLLA